MRKCTAIALSALLLQASPLSAADLVETAAGQPSFSLFIAALQDAGFADTLRSGGPFTIFAPTNEAFARLPEGMHEQLKKDKVWLSQVLSYHVVPGRIALSDMKPGLLKTTEGHSLKVIIDKNGVTVNQGKIRQVDQNADNGVLHAIDRLLLPPN